MSPPTARQTSVGYSCG